MRPPLQGYHHNLSRAWPRCCSLDHVSQNSNISRNYFVPVIAEGRSNTSFTQLVKLRDREMGPSYSVLKTIQESEGVCGTQVTLRRDTIDTGGYRSRMVLKAW